MNSKQLNSLAATDPAAFAVAVDVLNRLAEDWNYAAPGLCRFIADHVATGSQARIADVVALAQHLTHISGAAFGLEDARISVGAVNGSYEFKMGAPYAVKTKRGRPEKLWVTVAGFVYADPSSDNSGRNITHPAAVQRFETEHTVEKVTAARNAIRDLDAQIAALETQRAAAADLVGVVCSHLEF